MRSCRCHTRTRALGELEPRILEEVTVQAPRSRNGALLTLLIIGMTVATIAAISAAKQQE